MRELIDEKIEGYEELISPIELMNEFPLNKESKNFVLEGRQKIENILSGKEKRKIMIVGPCSIHNINEAIEYAKLLKILSEKVKSKFLILMRVYFEKPRTTIGWKGLINDPNLDESHDINKGYKLARKLLIELTNLKVLCATEYLESFTPQYIGDLISWAAIGARTAESQPHRQMVSGLSVPVGFKNATSGEIEPAVNAVLSSLEKHSFVGMNKFGNISIIKTKGNPFSHIVLRGGKDNSNFSKEDISYAKEKCLEKDIEPKFIIDCSHMNSNKIYKNQSKVLEEVIEQIKNNEKSIYGVMIESNLFEGNQPLSENLQKGVSITDACISFKETEKIILKAYNLL